MFNLTNYNNKSLIELYNMFASKKWDKLDSEQRVLLMQAVVNKEKKEVKQIVNKKADMQSLLLNIDTLKEFDIKVGFGMPGEGFAGRYEPERKCIILNECSFCTENKDDGIYAYYTLIHEFQHAVQDYLIRNINEYNEKSDEYKYVNRLRIVRDVHDRNICFCNINGNADFHFNVLSSESCTSWSLAHDLSEMLYTLSTTERDAFYYGKIKKDILCDNLKFQDSNVKISFNDCSVENELNNFRSTYKCQNISDTDIFNIIDKCIDNLYLGHLPENNLCASVMYDMTCIMLILRKESTEEKVSEKDINLLDREYKRKIMAEWNFTV